MRLIIVFLGFLFLLQPKTNSEESLNQLREWTFLESKEEKFVSLSTHGNVVHGNSIYFLIRYNNGKCNVITSFASISTYSPNPNLNAISKKWIPALIYNKPVVLKVIGVSYPKLFIGKLISIDLGVYDLDKYQEFLKKNKFEKIELKILDNPPNFNTKHPTLDNFKAKDYFDIPEEYWVLKGFDQAIKVGIEKCLKLI